MVPTSNGASHTTASSATMRPSARRRPCAAAIGVVDRHRRRPRVRVSCARPRVVVALHARALAGGRVSCVRLRRVSVLRFGLGRQRVLQTPQPVDLDGHRAAARAVGAPAEAPSISTSPADSVMKSVTVGQQPGQWADALAGVGAVDQMAVDEHIHRQRIRITHPLCRHGAGRSRNCGRARCVAPRGGRSSCAQRSSRRRSRSPRRTTVHRARRRGKPRVRSPRRGWRRSARAPRSAGTGVTAPAPAKVLRGFTYSTGDFGGALYGGSFTCAPNAASAGA